ncbi:hypothetical protein LPN01_14495 [Sphingomonas sp. A2-49]|uniref:hypothetical protein n=1 Tax=Sphingomonas sp. A2-49 TaxID=1391375 RepID=UPI0021D0559A|nr:hypothetical protein [Sphingomonas sp. A2-49]MCU6455290.1 hypothetical protein [Sphingomonas sp. A2-49]
MFAASKAFLIAVVHSGKFDDDFAVRWEPVHIFEGGQCLSDYLVCFVSSLISKLSSPRIDEMHGRIHRGRVIVPPLTLLIREPTCRKTNFGAIRTNDLKSAIAVGATPVRDKLQPSVNIDSSEFGRISYKGHAVALNGQRNSPKY